MSKRRRTDAALGMYVDPAGLLTFLGGHGLDGDSSSEQFTKSFQRLRIIAQEGIHCGQ